MVDTDREPVATDGMAAWLSSEAHDDEQAADLAFQRLCAAVPRVEPSAAFSAGVAPAAWRGLRRQRRKEVATTVAVLLLVVCGGVAGSWVTVRLVGGWLLASGAAMASGVLVSVVGALVAGLEWWMTGARVGSVVGEVLVYREIAGTLLAVELLGAGALYALHQLARRAGVNSAS